MGGGLSERPMELVLKTSGQKCLVGSNPTPSANETRHPFVAEECNKSERPYCRRMYSKTERDMPVFTAHNVLLRDGTRTLAGVIPMEEHPWMRQVRAILEIIYPGDKAELSVVDLGCLEGGYAVEFARMGFKTLGIEVRPENIACCEFVKTESDLPNLSFAQDTVWNFQNYGRFDVAFCSGLLYHLAFPKRFLEMVAASTRKVLFLQTHFSLTHELDTKFQLSPLTLNEGLAGRWYQEAVEGRESDRWGSWENDKSFWIRREDLLGVLQSLGFEIVFEQFDGAPERGLAQRLSEDYASSLRGTFVGIRRD